MPSLPHPPRRVLARLGALTLLASALGVLARGDGVAAGLAGLAIVLGWVLLRRRSRTRPVQMAVGFVIGALALGVVAAALVPTYRATANPVLVPGVTTRSAVLRTGTFEALGFVATDTEDSPAGVDRDAAGLSTLAATGAVLGRHPGTVEITPAIDTLLRAHANHARADLVVSNYDGTDFNPSRAEAMMRSQDTRQDFVDAIARQVRPHGWDGVVLDFENLPGAVRHTYPELLRQLRSSLRGRRVAIAVPAGGDASGADLPAFDFAQLGRLADRVVVMAYDQHDVTSAPGPVAGLPWVRTRLTAVERLVPAPKLLLGVPGYGYAWDANGAGKDLTYPQAHAMATAPGSVAMWDDVQQEWHVRTGSGDEAWYDDARSVAARTQLAVDDGLAGVALWRVGSEDPATVAQLPVIPMKRTDLHADRAVRTVPTAGLVALTFDDGPDPTWTPRILDVLGREHVPATFFVIGTAAQSHPALVLDEVHQGDVVANHTYSHPRLDNASAFHSKAEILGDQAVIEGITGRKPALFRSPYGAGDMSTGAVGSDQLAVNLGLHPVSWTVDSNDWLRPGTAAIAGTVEQGVTSRSIVLLHDGGGDRAQTVAALPGIIHQLRARGYAFTTADALDASVTTPYAVRHGIASQSRGMAVVAGFRLLSALRRAWVWLLVAIIVLSLLRIVLAATLAGVHWRRSRRRRPSTVAPYTSVSVVVPAHNEEAVLAKSLEALRLVQGPPLEVIVVDDGSNDGTAAVAESFGVTVVRQQQAGKATALNAGLRVAWGDIVVVLDADTVLDPGFLRAVLPHFADPRVGAVAGNVKVGNRTNLLGNLQALEYVTSLNLDRRAQATFNVVSVVPGAAGAFRRVALLDAGGYPTETLVEDMDLTVSMLRAGWRIPYEPAAVARTEAPGGVGDVLRQRRRWAFGTLQVVAKHGRALLDPEAGRVGLIGLPWMVLSQVVLPLVGPLLDVYLLYLLVSGRWPTAALVFGVGLAIDIAVAALAVCMEGADRDLLLFTPLLRILWRPLQLAAVVLSVHRWVHGASESWRRVRRYNTVPAAPLTGTSAA